MKRLLNLVECLGLLMLLVGCGAQAGAQPVTQISPLAVETPTAPPKVMATPVVAELPLCQFNSVPTSTVSAPPLESYVFSEPKVILTSTSAIGIAGWLPDNERLLITRDAPNGHQLIETFNVRTGITQVYADRYGANGKPVWVSALEAVAYSTIGKQGDELWISYGDPQKAERIAPDADGLTLATDGQQLIYFSPSTGDRPQVWNANTKTTQGLAVDLAQWYRYSGPEAYKPIPGHTFHPVWQPGGKQIAFYGYTKLFLMDSRMQGCEVDLSQAGKPRSAFYAQWSPNGRYLAMITVDPPPVSSQTRLALLDTVTGAEQYPDLKVPYVGDIAWSPDGQTMIVLGLEQNELKKGRAQLKLFLVNVHDGILPVFPNQTFGGAGIRWDMDWSSNSTIAIKCPVWPETEQWMLEDRVCLIDVTTNP